MNQNAIRHQNSAVQTCTRPKDPCGRNQPRLSIISFVLLLGLQAPAATITVTTLADDGPGSLRQAIADASAGDRIQFEVTGTIAVTNGPLAITNDLRIEGPGSAGLTLDARFANRIFEIDSGTMQLSGLRLVNGLAGFPEPLIFGHGGAILSHGDLMVSACVFSNNLAVGGGGAIYNSYRVRVFDSRIESCIAISGGALEVTAGSTGEVRRTTFRNNSADADGDGGAVENWGDFTIADSRFEGNEAPFGSGGAIMNRGNMLVTNCVLSANSATRGFDSEGGAINNASTLLILDSRLEGNFAIFGGGFVSRAGADSTILRSSINRNSSFHGAQGIGMWGGSVRITDSTISHNAGSFNENGGGFYVLGGVLALTNCTISGNGSSTGAGIANYAGDVVLDSCTVTANAAFNEGRGLRNEAGTFSLRNSIVAANRNQGFGQNTHSDLSGRFVSLGCNLIGESDGGVGFTNGISRDLIGSKAFPIIPRLGPLADNGGPAATHALLAGSPAIDAGHSDGMLVDQRGQPRPIDFSSIPNPGDGCDIGAFEVDPVLRVVALDRVAADLRLKFTTLSDMTYSVQWTAALSQPDWRALSSLPGTGGIVSAIDPQGAEHPTRFYRVEATRP